VWQMFAPAIDQFYSRLTLLHGN